MFDVGRHGRSCVGRGQQRSGLSRMIGGSRLSNYTFSSLSAIVPRRFSAASTGARGGTLNRIAARGGERKPTDREGRL
jgi:hypothetical protein